MHDLCNDAANGTWPSNKRKLYCIVELLDVVENEYLGRGDYLFNFLRHQCCKNDIVFIRQLAGLLSHNKLSILYRKSLIYNIFSLNNNIIKYICTFCNQYDQHAFNATCVVHNTSNEYIINTWFYKLLLSKCPSYPDLKLLISIYGYYNVLFSGLSMSTVSITNLTHLYADIKSTINPTTNVNKICKTFTIGPIQSITHCLNTPDILNLMKVNRYFWLQISSPQVLRVLPQFKKLQVNTLQSSVFGSSSTFFVFTDSKYISINGTQMKPPQFAGINAIVYEGNDKYITNWGKSIKAIHRIVNDKYDQMWNFNDLPESGLQLYIHSNDPGGLELEIPSKCKVIIFINSVLTEQCIIECLLQQEAKCIVLYDCTHLSVPPTIPASHIFRNLNYKTIIFMNKVDWWEMYHLFVYGDLFDKKIQNVKIKCKLANVTLSSFHFWDTFANCEWGPPKSIIQLFDADDYSVALDQFNCFVYTWLRERYQIVYSNQMIKEFIFVILINDIAYEIDLKKCVNREYVQNSKAELMRSLTAPIKSTRVWFDRLGQFEACIRFGVLN